MQETSTQPNRWRLSIGEAMVLVALAAIGCAWPGLIAAEIMVFFVCIEANRQPERCRGRLVSLGVVLAAVYFVPLVTFMLPAWIDSSDFADNREWQTAWSQVFAISPGLLIVFLVALPTVLAAFITFLSPDESMVFIFAVTSLATAAEVYFLTRLAGRTRGRRILAAIVGLLGSGISTVFTIMVMASMHV